MNCLYFLVSFFTCLPEAMFLVNLWARSFVIHTLIWDIVFVTCLQLYYWIFIDQFVQIQRSDIQGQYTKLQTVRCVVSLWDLFFSFLFLLYISSPSAFVWRATRSCYQFRTSPICDSTLLLCVRNLVSDCGGTTINTFSVTNHFRSKSWIRRMRWTFTPLKKKIFILSVIVSNLYQLIWIFKQNLRLAYKCKVVSTRF